MPRYIFMSETRGPRARRQFIDRCLMLQESGFKVRIREVAHPPLPPEIEPHILELKNEGIDDVSLIMFRGWYKGKYFPNAYSVLERDLVKKYIDDIRLCEVLDNPIKPYGKVCSAGVDFFSMDIQGNVRRCSTARESYGNLFDGTMRIDGKAKPCPYTRCSCPYEGLRNLTDTRAQVLSVAREMVNEYPVFLYKNLNRHRFNQRIRTFFTNSR